MANLKWTKDFFSNTYYIYSNNQLIGKLEKKSFAQITIGELNGKKYTFKTTGSFGQNTQIIDNEKNSIIGNIIYNSWMSKATLLMVDKSIYWRYGNSWNTKWSIFSNERIKIEYTDTFTSGQIESNTDDALLLLSGLYITNYYWQMLIAIIIFFALFYLTILN